MRYLRERQPTILSLPVLLLLSGCGGTEPDCASSDTRTSVIKTVSGNSNNELVDYAVRKSDALRAKIDTASTEAEKSAILEKARQDAVYQLSDTISTTSKSKVKRTVTCSADIFVTVEG